MPAPAPFQFFKVAPALEEKIKWLRLRPNHAAPGAPAPHYPALLRTRLL